MEVLREITEDELNYIISRLENDLPYAIKDLYFILSSKRSKEAAVNFTGISEKVLPTFYVPRNGIKDNCTIFAITSEPDHTVWFFTYQESLQEVKICLENTNLIMWTKTVLFVTIHREQVEAIFEHLRKNKYTMNHDEACSYFYLPKEDAKKIEIL